ncbi:MAG: hypothetical protein LBJ67_08585 [Planctomycetaceae bacterium]|jgi:hypothetical protein|nr:hypothetical protein [Planctomycetaceae bacterium]
MAIRIICKNCESKIDAKDELLGQTRKCPKCKNPILIVPATVAVSQPQLKKEVAPQAVSANNAENIAYDNMEHLMAEEIPTELKPSCRYFILAFDRMIAYWEIAKGWQYNIGTGYVSAKRNKDLLPTDGSYKFVEMLILQLDTGKQLAGLRIFSITSKWAIQAIGRENHEILAKIEEKGILNKQQRLQLLNYIRKNYMPDFLHNAKEVYDFLLADFTPENSVFVKK